MLNYYFCFILGENASKLKSWHDETIKRLQAWGLAIHIPILIWFLTSYFIAQNIFFLTKNESLIVAAVCTSFVYLLERIILLTPKNKFVNFGRGLIGIIMAILGASMADLILFDREITNHLQENNREKIEAEYVIRLEEKKGEVKNLEEKWALANAEAQCEADGTCGSGKSSIGPIYRKKSSMQIRCAMI